MTSRPVHVVVVAFHAPAQLERCLERLGNRFPVTVVDNSSSPEVKAAVDRAKAGYLDPGGNLGFGTGVNLALRRLLEGPPKDVLLVNPDALVEPHGVEELAGFLHGAGDKRLGAVAPLLVSEDGSSQRVEWPFPSPWRGVAEAAGLGRFPARHSFVIGAVLLLRWEALREVGLFDERFFLYAEETDWQRRALACGWRSAVCPSVTAVHAGAGTSSDSARREVLFHAAHETYMRKWHGGAGWLLYRFAACAGAAARVALLCGDRRAAAARRAVLYARGPRRTARLA